MPFSKSFSLLLKDQWWQKRGRGRWGKCESRKAVGAPGDCHGGCNYLHMKHLSVTLQSHSLWKDFKFWSCGHSRGLLPRKLSDQLQLPWTWLDGSFQQNQHKVLLTQICLLWVFVEASNFTLQIIILSCFTWILAKNTWLAQPAAIGSFLERKSCRGIKNGEKVQAPPLLWPWWSLGWWDTAHVGPVLINVFVPSGLCQCELQCWPEQIQGFDPSWSSKAISFLELGSLGDNLGSPAKAVHPMRNPFQLFFWILPGCCCQKHFYSSCPNCCRYFPRCEKHVHILSKLQNHLPGLL